MAVLHSNPEVLLKRRKDKDRKRLEKQEEARAKEAARRKARKAKADKFVRIETVISNVKSKKLEQKRVKNVSKGAEKELDVEERLLFVIRMPNHTKGLKIPGKAQSILKLLKLENVYNGVFFKLSSTTEPLLKIIDPYVIYGTPSLASIRNLFQKRATIQQDGQILKLDNNQLVEDRFEDIGVICIEDIVSEITGLSENFKALNSWLHPFKLNVPVTGFGPQSKLAKLKYEQQARRGVSLAGDVVLKESDVDAIVEGQN